MLGEGAYGTVFKVKCLKTSVITSGAEGTRVVLDANKKKMAKLKTARLGLNVTSTLSKQSKKRTLLADQNYVIKEIDTSKLP